MKIIFTELKNQLNKERKPCLIYIHGGGMIMGNLDTGNLNCFEFFYFLTNQEKYRKNFLNYFGYEGAEIIDKFMLIAADFQKNRSPNLQKFLEFVEKIDPEITWENPADIGVGVLLSATQLNATADAAGTFTYTPGIGVALDEGENQELKVEFTIPYLCMSYILLKTELLIYQLLRLQLRKYFHSPFSQN